MEGGAVLSEQALTKCPSEMSGVPVLLEGDSTNEVIKFLSG